MKKDINLLPWRLWQQRRQNKALLAKLALGTLICASAWLWLHTQTEQQAERAENLQQAQITLQRELQLTQQQIQQFRHQQSTDNPPTAISKETVFSLLNQLAELPLTQGELSTFSLAEQKLTISGYSLSQEEFAQINRFLTEQPLFDEVKLTEFTPQPQDMLFRFDLTLRAQP